MALPYEIFVGLADILRARGALVEVGTGGKELGELRGKKFRWE